MTEETIVPGNSILTRVNIFDDDKKFVDITGIVTGCSITESMDSKTTTAVITVADSNDVIGKFPILGHELVEIAWESPAPNEQLDIEERIEVFRIAKISNMQAPESMENATTRYALILISQLAFLQDYVDVNQGFSDTISNIIEKIHNNLLSAEVGSIKVEEKQKYELYSKDETDNIFDFVAPSDAPFDALDKLLSWSFSSKYKSSTFFYYQNKHGYNFRTLESIVEEWETKPEDDGEVLARDFTFNITGESNATTGRGNTISNFAVHNRGNALELAATGRLSNRVNALDFVKKKVVVHDYNYKDHKDTYKMFGSSALMSNTFLDSVTSAPTQSHWIYVDGSKRNNDFPQALNQKWAFNSLVMNSSMSIVIPGASYITVGDVLNINIPMLTAVAESDEIPNDEFISGKYVAKDVMHTFNQEGYLTQVNLIRLGSEKQVNEI